MAEAETLDDIRSRDLSSGTVARAKAPKPTWFIERTGDGYIFPVEEKEAWDIINNRSEWKRHDFKFIGFSDGKTYQRIVSESLNDAKILEPEAVKLRKEIQQYRNLEDKLMLDEVVDMDDLEDPDNAANVKKVMRIRGIVEKLDTKLEKIEEELRNATGNVVRRATEAELKVARANWKKQKVWPADDVNIITPKASPKERAKILKNMPG